MSLEGLLLHMDEGGSLHKSGHAALLAHVAKTLAAEHADMHKFHKDHHDSLDDGHEDKPVHKRLAQHHALKAQVYGELHKALTGEAPNRGGASSGFGYETGDLDGPSKMRRAVEPMFNYPSNPPESVRLVPRAGAAGGGVAKVDVQHEEMFGGM